MDNNDTFTGKVLSLVADIREYIKLRLEYLQISGTELLVRIISGIVIFQIITTLMAFALLFLTVAFTIWIGGILDSYPLACLITSVLYVILILLLIAFRRTLIIDRVTRLVVRLIEKTREGKNE